METNNISPKNELVGSEVLRLKTSIRFFVLLFVWLFIAHAMICPIIAKLVGIEDVAITYRDGVFISPELHPGELILSIMYYDVILIPIVYFLDSGYKIVELYKNKIKVTYGLFFKKSVKEFHFEYVEFTAPDSDIIIHCYNKDEKKSFSLISSNSDLAKMEDYAEKNGISYEMVVRS